MQRTLTSTRLWLGASWALVASAIAAGPPAAAQVPEALFTAEQAARGRGLYRNHCASCHGGDLLDGTAPPLRGIELVRRWSLPEVSVGDLFFLQSTTMPPGQAGALTPAQHADVLAYILGENGYVAGTVPLAAELAMLAELRLPPPQGAVLPGKEPAPAFIVGSAQAAMTAGGPTQEELEQAAASSENWLHHTHNYSGTRYSPLREIDTANVARLQVACVYQVGEQSTFQTGPIVYEGTLYLTTDWVTVALDASTCKPKWRYRWERRDQAVWNNNRGVAIKEGRLVRGTLDGYLLSLNAATGELIWARQIADPRQGETFTMSPTIFEDLVLIGPAGSENKINGWIGAFRLRDGAPVWRFNTIPKPGEPGSETWQNEPDVPVGGGAIWTPLSLDVKEGELYVAVTNPAPDLPAFLRPGANLYTNALVALDVRTGKLRWYRQLVPNDSHDYDLTQVSPLLEIEADGRKRRVVVTSGKDGMLRTIDRDSHEILYETPVTTIKDAHLPVTTEGIHACPGTLGGVEWNGSAYHPGTNLLYTPAVDWCSFFKAAEKPPFLPGRMYFGGSAQRDEENQGWLTAIDAATGELRWRYRSERPLVAAVTTTAGGLVMTGELDGSFLVLDARDGDVLHRFNTGGSMGGGIVTYAVGGKQYIAAASGLPSGFWVDEHPGSPTLLVFALP